MDAEPAPQSENRGARARRTSGRSRALARERHEPPASQPQRDALHIAATIVTSSSSSPQWRSEPWREERK